MRIPAEGLRDDSFELGLNLIDSLSRRQTGPVAHSEHMRVDGECLFTERGVEDDIRGLTTDPRQLLQLLACARHFAIVIANQRLRECDHVFRFGVEQTNGFDCFAQFILAQGDHLRRRHDLFEQRLGGDVDACVSCLRREHNRDEQRVRIDEIELSRRRWICFRQPPEEFENLFSLH